MEAGRGEWGGIGSGFDETSVGISSGLRGVAASLSDVGMSSVDTVLPHDEQKRARGGSSVPQELQRAILTNASNREWSTAVYVNAGEMEMEGPPGTLGSAAGMRSTARHSSAWIAT